MEISWILITILITIILLLVLMIFAKRKYNRSIDYYNLFIIGIIWAAVGVPLNNFGLSVLGIIFMIVGLVHKKEWNKNQRRWKNLNKKERKIVLAIMITLLILVLLGFVMMVVVENKLSMSLEQAISIAKNSECVKEGGILTENYFYNEYTKTWWFDLQLEKEGCNPACVIEEETHSAEINWRCTGLPN